MRLFLFAVALMAASRLPCADGFYGSGFHRGWPGRGTRRTTHPRSAYTRASYPRMAYPRAAYPRATHPRTAYSHASHPRTTYPRTAYSHASHSHASHPHTTHPHTTQPPRMEREKKTSIQDLGEKFLISIPQSYRGETFSLELVDGDSALEVASRVTNYRKRFALPPSHVDAHKITYAYRGGFLQIYLPHALKQDIHESKWSSKEKSPADVHADIQQISDVQVESFLIQEDFDAIKIKSPSEGFLDTRGEFRSY